MFIFILFTLDVSLFDCLNRAFLCCCLSLFVRTNFICEMATTASKSTSKMIHDVCWSDLTFLPFWVSVCLVSCVYIAMCRIDSPQQRMVPRKWKGNAIKYTHVWNRWIDRFQHQQFKNINEACKPQLLHSTTTKTTRIRWSAMNNIRMHLLSTELSLWAVQLNFIQVYRLHQHNALCVCFTIDVVVSPNTLISHRFRWTSKYNGKRYPYACIESLRLRLNIQVICINDANQDLTFA